MYTESKETKIKQITERIQNDGAKLIKIYESPQFTLKDTKFEFICKKNHHNLLSYQQINTNDYICVECTHLEGQEYFNKVLRPLLQQKNIVSFTPYKNMQQLGNFQCQNCNHTFQTKYIYIKTSKQPCPICNGYYAKYTTIEKTLQSLGLEILDPILFDENTTISSRQKLNIRCTKCGFEFETTSAKLKRNKPMCNKCANLSHKELQAINIGIIYKGTFPNGKVYIGQTIRSFAARLNKHKRDAVSEKTPEYYTLIGKAIRKYGFDNIQWEILHDNVIYTQLDDLEIAEIKKHDSFHNGYNSTEGGKFNYMNANLANKHFQEHLANQLRKEKDARATAQKRSLTNFEKNLKKDLREFIKKDISLAELERDEILRRQHLSKNAKEKRLRILNGIDKKSSQYRGVTWDKVNHKWKASIKNKGKKIHIGLFVNEKDAAIEYDKKAKELHGEKARLNFP